MTITVTAKIVPRQGTAAAWTSANPTLLFGERGIETDTGYVKLGDGTTAWNDLDYVATDVTVSAHIASTSNPHSVTAEQVGALTSTAADLVYAPIAKGVTNGDSHDHSGGDGAQIAYSGLSGLPTLGTAAATASTDYATASHAHSGTYEPADATILKQADVDDTPVNGVTTAPVSSNWAFDHAALTTAHGISTFGGTLVDDADAGTARTTLGLGTAATTASTDYATASHNHSGTYVAPATLPSGAIYEKSSAISAAEIDVAASSLFTKTISGNTTFTVANIPASGTVASFVLILTNGGSATVNWWSGMQWAGGTAPALTASGVDVLGFLTFDGGTVWSGFVLGKDLKAL